jgi:hypothetical protein
MSDIKELLERTARSVDAIPSEETVESDVRRGRAALVRRRRGRAIASLLAAAALLVAAAVVAGNLSATRDSVRLGSGNSSRQASGSDTVTSVRLVAYHGAQLQGFTVNRIPDGWYLQGSNAYRLTVAPQGDTSSPDAFEGKLVVMLLSSSARQQLPKGQPVKVGDHDGVVSRGDADVLTFQDDAGHFVQIEAWHRALGWSTNQLIRFAEGVHVTSDARAGVG